MIDDDKWEVAQGRLVWVSVDVLLAHPHWKDRAGVVNSKIRGQQLVSYRKANDGFECVIGESIISADSPESVARVGVTQWTQQVLNTEAARNTARSLFKGRDDNDPAIALFEEAAIPFLLRPEAERKQDIEAAQRYAAQRSDLPPRVCASCNRGESVGGTMVQLWDDRQDIIYHRSCLMELTAAVNVCMASQRRIAPGVSEHPMGVVAMEVEVDSAEPQRESVALVEEGHNVPPALVHSRSKRGVQVVERADLDEGPLGRRTRARTAAEAEKKYEQQQGPEDGGEGEDGEGEDQDEEDQDEEDQYEEDDEQDDRPIPEKRPRSQMTAASP